MQNLPQVLVLRSTIRNMPWDLFCCVFDFGVHVSVNLVTAITAEESVVNLPATIE